MKFTKWLPSVHSRFCRIFTVVLFSVALGFSVSKGHANPFAGGWTLDQSASSLTFQSIKNGSKLETSNFASFQATVDEKGAATLRVQLDSVDTKVDLRNVRMRFLFFETFRFKEAVVTTIVDPELVVGLSERRRINIPLTFELDLHGVKQSMQVETVVTALAGDQVSVASVAPLSIATNMFNLDEGVKKLEEAANVTIVPMGSVAFNLVFNTEADTLRVPNETPEPVTTAVESSGDFSFEECSGRFEILSRTGSIYFRSGSADLDAESDFILGTVIDIINRCPVGTILIAGHTDSSGSDEVNQRLSEFRASSVLNYLVNASVDPVRLRSVGFGESRPVAANDTPRNRRLNRRIEFSLIGN